LLLFRCFCHLLPLSLPFVLVVLFFALLWVASPVSSSSCYLSACFLCGSCSFSYFFSYSLLLLQLWHLFNRLLCLVTLLPRRSALFNSLRTRRTLCCCCNYGTFLTDYSAWLPCCLAVQRYSFLFVRYICSRFFALVRLLAQVFASWSRCLHSTRDAHWLVSSRGLVGVLVY
jgi:hypothetical protein